MKKILRTGPAGIGRLDARLAAYGAAAGAIGLAAAAESQGEIVANMTEQPFGINGAVPIDFNSDGQIDFELDHDRVDLGGGNLVDYLQIDKNDFNGASVGENLLPISDTDTFDVNGTIANDLAESKYVIPTGAIGEYPASLTAGTPIGPASTFDFQEGTNFNSTGRTIRANRLIDEDATQADMILGGLASDKVQVPFNGPNFLGSPGEVQYLGLRMDLNNTDQFNFGWVGIRIDNEADATGSVVGWAYETVPGVAINAGQIPEPGSAFLAVLGVVGLFCGFLRRRARR